MDFKEGAELFVSIGAFKDFDWHLSLHTYIGC